MNTRTGNTLTDGRRQPPVWTKDHTQAWLTGNPLPAGLRWLDHNDNLLPVEPRFPILTTSFSYGKWLRDNPYFPGLFEAVHDILSSAFRDATLPTMDQLLRELELARKDYPPLRPLIHPGAA
jgi:hypothetical protein